MAKVDVEIGLTLSLKGRMPGMTQFEFIRPSIAIRDIEVDGEVSVKEQLDLARRAIKPVWDTVDKAIEILLQEQFSDKPPAKKKPSAKSR